MSQKPHSANRKKGGVHINLSNHCLSTPKIKTNVIIYCDCLHYINRKIPDECIDLAYLDPPCLGNTKSRNQQTLTDHLCWIEQIIKEIHRTLKDSGTLLVQTDPHLAHYFKIILDKIFGTRSFRNEIIYIQSIYQHETGPLLGVHDNILYYTKGNCYTFNKGAISKLNDVWNEMPNSSCEMRFDVDQQPETLIEKCILLFSNEGEIVLDPMSGTGTTCVVANRLKRRFIGIDNSLKACRIARARLFE